MIPTGPDIDKNIKNALGLLDRNLDMCPDSFAAMAIGSVFQRHLRYCYDTKEWLFWNGTVWQREKATAALNTWCCWFIVRHLHPALPSLTPYRRSSMLNHKYLTSVREQLQLDRRLLVSFADFDADPYRIGTPSGTVDLTNGKLYAPAPEHMISRQTRCDVAGRKDKAPQWTAFLNWMTQGDKDLARFLQMWLGLSLVGNARDQKIVFLWGDSANGKSVLLRAAARVAGSYHHTASLHTFMVKQKQGGANPNLVDLLGSRMVTGTEVPKGAEWDTQMIKQICSDEEISERRLYSNPVSIEPRCNVTLAGNDLPAFTGLDDAVKRRFVTVHCRAKVADADRIDDYGKELVDAEGPAILRWLVEGALDRHNNGLIIPESVRVASAEYFDSEDVLARFVAERYEVDPDGSESSTEMFRDWQDYNKGLGRPHDLTQTAFGLRLHKMGFPKGRQGGTGRMLIKGLRRSGGSYGL